MPFTVTVCDQRGVVVGTLSLDSTRRYLGRGGDNDLVLQGSGVSRRHASLYQTRDGRVVIEDEGSANGVVVNGELLEGPAFVSERDVIGISSFRIRVQARVADAPGGGAQRAANRADHPESEELDPETRLEAHPSSVIALARVAFVLAGRGRPVVGRRFVVDKPLFTVGRAEDCDLVLDDPSVSRRHAQLRVSPRAEFLTVVDLRSHNGTFVGEERIKRAELRPQQSIRFGDLRFVLEAKGADERSAVPRFGRWLVLLLLLGAIGFGGWWINDQLSTAGRPSGPQPDPLREQEAALQRMLQQAQRLYDRRQWVEAIAAFGRVIEVDPLNSQAATLRQRAKRERDYERLFRQARKTAVSGEREALLRAKQLYASIPPSSAYAEAARLGRVAIDRQLAREYRSEGVSRCRVRHWARCHQALCRFFALLEPDDPVRREKRLRQLLVRAERQLRRRGVTVQACTAARPSSGPKDTAQQDVSLQRLLAKRWPFEPLRRLVAKYVEGKVDVVLRELGLLRRERTARPYLAEVDRVEQAVRSLRSGYTRGYTAFRDRDIDRAETEWMQVLSAERQLIPKSVRSFYRQEIVRQLTSLFAELGREALEVGGYRRAFAFLLRGQSLDAVDVAINKGLLELEKVADRLIDEAQRMRATGPPATVRGKLSLARDICRPGRPTRELAEKILSSLQVP